MTVQQVSFGGSTAPLGVNMTSQQTSLTQQPDSSKKSTTPAVSGDNALYPLENVSDINSVWNTGEAPAWDPFQLNPIYQNAAGTTPVSNESQSPGYQAYGPDWVNLLTAVNGMPKSLYGGEVNPTAVVQEELSNYGKDLPANVSSQLTPLRAQLYVQSNDNQTGAAQATEQQITDLINPLGPDSTAYRRVSSGGDALNSDPVSLALDAVSKTFGLDPTSSEAKNLANAYTTYAEANKYRTDLIDNVNEANSAGSFENILGRIGEVVGYTAAGGAAGWAAGGAAAASAAAEAASAAEEGATAASTAQAAADAAEEIQIFNGVRTGLQGGEALINHDYLGGGLDLLSAGNTAFGSPIPTAGIQGLSAVGNLAGGNYTGAATSAAGAAGSLVTSPSGTDGTNAAKGGGIVSSAADTLGLTPDELKELVGDLGVAGSVAGTAAPIIKNSLDAPSVSDIEANVAAPLAAPVAESAPLGVPASSGEAITPITQPNAAQAGYKPPGGNAQLMQLLKELSLQAA